jgi:hypothetical protein
VVTVPPSRPERAPSTVLAGALVLAAGRLAMLFGDVLGSGGAPLCLGLGAAFAADRFVTDRCGFAVPAGPAAVVVLAGG